MAQGKIFEYAVLYHHKPRKVEGHETTAPSELVVDVKRIVAVSEKEVAIRASREIPEDLLEKLDQVEIVIRPF